MREIKTTRAFRKHVLGPTSKWNAFSEVVFLTLTFYKLESKREGYDRYYIKCKPNLLGKLFLIITFPIDVLFEGLAEFKWCWNNLKENLTGELWSRYKDVKRK